MNNRHEHRPEYRSVTCTDINLIVNIRQSHVGINLLYANHLHNDDDNNKNNMHPHQYHFHNKG